MYSIYELLPKELKDLGYNEEIIFNLYKQLYIKKEIEVNIILVEDEPVQVNSLEGLVMAMPGMYIATGVRGEKFVVDQNVLDTTYNKINNKENTYIKKPYPVIAEKKKDTFVVPYETTNSGVLRGKAGDYLIQSMINSKNIYPIDCGIFEETYIPYIDYLREKTGVYDEPFKEETMKSIVLKRENIFNKIVLFLKNMFMKEEA